MGFFDWLSWGLDIIPGIGEAKAILELFTGKDLITQEDLDDFDRATCSISLIPAIGWISKFSKASKAAKHASKFKKFFTLVEKANKANDAIDKFNFIRNILEDSGCDTSEMSLDERLIVNPKNILYINDPNRKVIEPTSYVIFTKDRKQIDLVEEIINGKYGNGEERKRRIEAMGYNYNIVQRCVNNRLNKK